MDIICTLKNRAENFTFFIDSLNQSDLISHEHMVTIIDFMSDDIDLYSKLAAYTLNYQVIKIPSSFNRALGLQIGFENTSHDKVIFLDVDIVVAKGFFNYINSNIEPGKCVFPICFSFFSNQKTTGYWRYYSYGLCGFHRNDFHTIGGWNLIFDGYGFEDQELFLRSQKSLVIKRDKLAGFYHLWHPNLLKWKTQYHNKEIQKAPSLFYWQNKMYLWKRFLCESLKLHFLTWKLPIIFFNMSKKLLSEKYIYNRRHKYYEP